jgi:hypothetical protein
MVQRIHYILVASLIALTLAGCTKVNRAVNTVTEATTSGTTGSTSSGGGGAMTAGMSMDSMTMQLFRGTFFQGGYVLDTVGFQPGEYVQWRVAGQGNQEWIRKALLRQRADGAEWWRVKQKTSDSLIVMEALLEAKDDSSERRILRLRRRFGQDEQPEEVPITKDNARKWTLKRQRELTEESYKGMKVGAEQLNVPAGTFNVEHLRSTHPQRGGTVHWYLNSQVPGGLVKYRWTSNGSSRELVLTDYGTGSTSSELGAF